jgi:hypothetical protein
MNDFIINVLQLQGPTIPTWLPVLGGFPINSPIVGSFIAIFVSVLITLYTVKRNGDSNRRYIESVERSSREHISAVEKASTYQINYTNYWRDLKRKQQLKSLILELEKNVDLCNYIVEKTNKKEYTEEFFNFFFISIEKCLSDTPIDDSIINNKLLITYYIMKQHDNAIIASRIPYISDKSLELIFQKIVWDTKLNQTDIDETIELIRLYEQKIKLYPPDGAKFKDSS